MDMTYVADAAEVTGLELLVKIEKKTQFSPSYPLDDGQPLVLKVVCYHSRSIAVGEEEPARCQLATVNRLTVRSK